MACGTILGIVLPVLLTAPADDRDRAEPHAKGLGDGAPTSLVVGLGDPDPPSAAALQAAAEQERAGGNHVLEPRTIVEKLAASGSDDAPDAEAVARMLAEARELNARFEPQGALEILRAIRSAYEGGARVSPSLLEVVANAAFDEVAIHFAEGDADAARDRAVEARRRFPSVTASPTRYPPTVLAILDAAAQQVADRASGRLVVRVDGPCTLWADGRELGRSQGRIERSLPVGRYRIWAQIEGGPGPVQDVVVSEQRTEVALAVDLERCLTVGPPLTLTCPERWPANLIALGRRLGATRVVAVPATGLRAEWPSPPPTEGAPILVVAGPSSGDTSSELSSFSLWYLMPLGGGQLAQDRMVAAGAILAIDLALAAWHISALLAHEGAIDDGDFEREPDLRQRRNLSAGLVAGAVVAGVAEALLYGWLNGE